MEHIENKFRKNPVIERAVDNSPEGQAQINHPL